MGNSQEQEQVSFPSTARKGPFFLSWYQAELGEHTTSLLPHTAPRSNCDSLLSSCTPAWPRTLPTQKGLKTNIKLGSRQATFKGWNGPGREETAFLVT